MGIKIALLGGVTMGMIILLALLGYYHNKAQLQAIEISQLNQDKIAAQLLITQQTSQITAFNAISKDQQDEKQQVEQQSNERIVYIRAAAKNSACSTQPVPAAIVDRLRQYADQIRGGAAGTHSAQLAD